MTVSIKYSWLEKKSNKKIRSTMFKYSRRKTRLVSIYRDSKEFGIPLSEISLNVLAEKYSFYSREIGKLNSYWNWKFNPNYKGGFNREYYFRVFKPEISFYRKYLFK